MHDSTPIKFSPIIRNHSSLCMSPPAWSNHSMFIKHVSEGRSSERILGKSVARNVLDATACPKVRPQVNRLTFKRNDRFHWNRSAWSTHSRNTISHAHLFRKSSNQQVSTSKWVRCLAICASTFWFSHLNVQASSRRGQNPNEIQSTDNSLSLLSHGLWQTMYRRLIDAQHNKNKVDPEVTLQFLKSAVYYFLTDKENSQGHLNAIESILGFSDLERLKIDQARASK